MPHSAQTADRPITATIANRDTTDSVPRFVPDLPRHAAHDVIDAAPGVEPVVKQPQLRLVHRHKAEPDSGAQEAGARVAEAVGPVNGETYGAGPFGGITSSASAPTMPPRDERRAALCTAP
jgi:hypothetical protein